jgi:hypothetical protein
MLPNSGKTTLLKLVGSITGPALFRSIEKWGPTIAIDEADTAFVNNDDLKDVVNSGWTRGDSVIRCDPETRETRPYSTFCPKAIGMIGRRFEGSYAKPMSHNRHAAQATGGTSRRL